MMPADKPETLVQEQVDHVFRRDAGRLVAMLTSRLGPANLEIAEEAVQDAMVAALRRWPFHGSPDHPGAWLYRVAFNRARDRMRHRSIQRDHQANHLQPVDWSEPKSITMRGEISDDQLRLMFLSCHPELSRDARIALTLKVVLGFSVEEIAHAFLAKKTTIAQRLSRAKHRINVRALPFEFPAPDQLANRLNAILEVLYLMFNEGYASHGSDLLREDLCAEALRFVVQLTSIPTTDRPQTHALAALMAFQASRSSARLDGDGHMVLLEDQNRGRWDQSLIKLGFKHLHTSMNGPVETAYHLESAIAAQHSAAQSADKTDWPQILKLYDRLAVLNPTPVVLLNRSVAIARVRGAEAGLLALSEIEAHPALRIYYLLPATRAALLADRLMWPEAVHAYQEALEWVSTDPERRFLQGKLRIAAENREKGVKAT